MKYLYYDELELLNNTMACMDTGDSRIFARIEAYSCKNTEEDRKLKAFVESRYSDHPTSIQQQPAQGGGGSSIPTGHNRSSSGSSLNYNDGQTMGGSFISTSSLSFQSPKSPFGPLNQPVSRKTFFYLLATLNAAFPDYDFSELKPDAFSKVPSASIPVTTVNNTMLAHLASSGSEQKNISANIWDAIDNVIEIQECDIYSFNPDGEFEPEDDNGSNLWSFYYFFVNRKLKRIVFLTARAVSFLAPAQPEEFEIYNNAEDPGSYSYTTNDVSMSRSNRNDGDDAYDPVKARRPYRDVGGEFEANDEVYSAMSSSDDEATPPIDMNDEDSRSNRFGRTRRRYSQTHLDGREPLPTITDQSSSATNSPASGRDNSAFARPPPHPYTESSTSSYGHRNGNTPYSRGGEGTWQKSRSRSRNRRTSKRRAGSLGNGDAPPTEENKVLDQIYQQHYANGTRQRSSSSVERGLSYEQYMMGEMEM